MNVPPFGSSRSDASVSSPASEFTTTSTPAPPVAARNSASNPALREEEMCASSRPMPASTGHLAALAVANTSRPRCRAICTAAIPTPPAAACTSTF